MGAFTCPRCRNAVEMVPALAGQTVACPHCAGHITMPTLPVAASVVSEPVAVTGGMTFERVAASRLAELRKSSGGILSLLDLKFERYLTPWIIRGLWVLALVGAVFWIASSGLGALASALPNSSTDSKSRTRNSDESMSLNEPPFPIRPNRWLAGFSRGFAFLLNVVLTVIALLWVRVAFESIIVLFNISNSLTSIDGKTIRKST